jgi:hypothetical protein
MNGTKSTMKPADAITVESNAMVNCGTGNSKSGSRNQLSGNPTNQELGRD